MVRQLLLTGAIEPGEVIDEKAIATQLNVSRTPVREAVKRLVDEHLVDVFAQSATRAARLNRREIEESFLIRRALEMESAAQAAPRMTQLHADRLAEIIGTHAKSIERRSFAEAIAHDDDFHRYIATISDLPRLWSTIEVSKGHIDRCRHMMLPISGEAEVTLEHHRRIVRALNTKDPEQARRAMQDHIEISYRRTEAVLDGKAII
jgi:DNA-binding GntR family transcriptional regulator